MMEFITNSPAETETLGAALGAGEEVPAVTYVPDSVFVAGGTESELGITMTQEVLDGRAY